MIIINGQRVATENLDTPGILQEITAENTRNPVLLLDDGFAFGRGAFETLPIYLRPLWLERHISRLNRTLALLNINRKIEPAEILDVIDRENIRHTVLKVIVTQRNLVLTTRPLPTPDPAGVTLMVNPEGHPAVPPLAGLKTLNYLGYLLAREKAVQAGYSDALLMSSTGQVLETTVANIFIVRGGCLVTPVADGSLLPGIVRQHVLETFKAREVSLTLEDVLTADVVLVSNSLIGVQRVARIGDRWLHDASSSIALQAIQDDYAAAVSQCLI